MWVFRLALTAIVLMLILLAGIIEHVITWVVGKFDPDACLRMRSGYVRLGLKAIWFVAAGKTKVIGLERIPTDRPVLFAGNHRSLLDVVICGSLIPVPVGFVSKKELEKIPLLRMQMRDINCLFLDRKDDRKALKVILRAIELVRGGKSMFIFPEGTRSKEEGKFLPFHTGSFRIATKAGVPVVPVTIVGTGDILEDHFPKIKAAPVVVEFGEPIETASMSSEEQKELSERVRNLIIETYERNRRLL